MPYLTPDSGVLVESPGCRVISVPGDLWFYVTGALEYLSKEWNWEQFGTATPEEMSQFFMGVLDDYQQSACGGGMNHIGSQFVQILDKSSANGDNPNMTILQTSLPAEAQGCSGIMCYLYYAANKDMAVQWETYGNKASGFLTLPQPVGNRAMQMIIPMDETGGKFLLSAIGGLSSWSVDLFLCSWW